MLTAQHDELCTEAGMFVQSNANMAFHAGPVLPTTTTQKPLVMDIGQTSLERCDPSLADLVNMGRLPPHGHQRISLGGSNWIPAGGEGPAPDKYLPTWFQPSGAS